MNLGALAISNMIFRPFDSRLAGTMRGAKKCVACLDAVADDPAAAVFADRRQTVDSAFETIENVRVSRLYDLERQIIVVPANFASCHYGLHSKSSAFPTLEPRSPSENSDDGEPNV